MSQPRTARFCPICGDRLTTQQRGGAERPVCPGCDHTIYFDPKVAVAVLIQHQGRILLVRRANDPFKDYWTLPAGFMEWDENPQAAGSREVLEETGLHVETHTLLDVFHTPDDGGLADIVIVYEAGIRGGVLQASDDAADAVWFGPQDVPAQIAFLPTQTIVRRWLAGK